MTTSVPEALAVILVCGGRDYHNRRRIKEILASYLPTDSRVGTPTIVHGAAPGADQIAGEVAQRLGFWVEAFPANWTRFGRAAGPMRNERLALRVSRDHPCLCIAFPGGFGTADMVRRAERWGIPIQHVPPDA